MKSVCLYEGYYWNYRVFRLFTTFLMITYSRFEYFKIEEKYAEPKMRFSELLRIVVAELTLNKDCTNGSNSCLNSILKYILLS